MVGRIFLGRYQALRLLGEGGMGRVYLAKQLDLGRNVVVKVMHDHVAADPLFCERFQRETLLMAQFQHPYAVTLYDATLDDPEGPCIIMEYIRGVTLDTLLEKNRRLSPQRVGRILGQLCEVLQAAHSQGIIHRDLKPANLMVVDPDTPYEKIKVMDFGLAKLMASSSKDPGAVQTNADFAVGTPGYICPEQVRGEEMDHRGDLYSVGVILYELLSGKQPFSGRASMDMLLAHATEEPPTFDEQGAANWVWPALEEVVMACMAKDPAQRPAHARELAERYQMALEQETQTPAPLPTASPSAHRSFPQPVTAGKSINSGIRQFTRTTDPFSIIHELEAWMPEQIAAYKLKGFVQDAGGQVLESIPGRIKVLLGGQGSYAASRGPLAWFGLGRKGTQIELELGLHKIESGRDNLLHITVAMRPVPRTALDAEWRSRCNQIYIDLRSYLMGKTSSITDRVDQGAAAT